LIPAVAVLHACVLYSALLRDLFMWLATAKLCFPKWTRQINIVSFNLTDFPQSALAPYGLEARHPDVFLCQLFDQAAEAFLQAHQEMVSELKNPPRTVEQHPDVLRNQRLTETAGLLATRLPEAVGEPLDGETL